MTKAPFLTTLVFTLTMFSSTCYAEWTKVAENVEGTFYLDVAKIRKVDGYIYWWELRDYWNTDKTGIWSVKGYLQGDCTLFKVKFLKLSAHEEPMGEGAGEIYTPPKPKWNYPLPNSGDEIILETVCEYANQKFD